MTEQAHFEGMEPPKIGPLTAAIRKAHKMAKERKEAQDRESNARSRVLDLMHEHREQLIQPDTGNLVYKTSDGVSAVLKPGKEKLSVKLEDKKEPQEGEVDILDDE